MFFIEGETIEEAEVKVPRKFLKCRWCGGQRGTIAVQNNDCNVCGRAQTDSMSRLSATTIIELYNVMVVWNNV